MLIREAIATGSPRTAVIVGGSLTGLAAAIRLARAGLQVTVLERSPGFAPGTGIGIDRDQLSRVTGVSAYGEPGYPALPVTTRPWESTSWTALHAWLQRIAEGSPGVELSAGSTVISVQSGRRSATASTVDRQYGADVVVGADGYGSLVRRFIAAECPDAHYAGYGLWRGTIPEAELPPGVDFARRPRMGSLWTDRHRLVAYEIPGPAGEVGAGQRTINWVWYDPDCTTAFEASGCVQHGVVKRSLLPHEFSPPLVGRLEKLARQHWPDPWRSVILSTLAAGRVFATPIAEYVPKRLTLGRLALLGDAAHVAVPATGAGLFTGLEDVASLGQAIEAERRGGRSALETYERERLGPARRLGESSRAWSRSYLGRQDTAATG
jgi:2-polyprenyl-6-methoxyphenol hydroxylase-like FAD-dependent oxidoreductase